MIKFLLGLVVGFIVGATTLRDVVVNLIKKIKKSTKKD